MLWPSFIKRFNYNQYKIWKIKNGYENQKAKHKSFIYNYQTSLLDTLHKIIADVIMKTALKVVGTDRPSKLEKNLNN